MKSDLRHRWMALTMGIAWLWLAAVPAQAQESDRDRAERIARMTPEQKEKLLQKKERFDALSDQEREKLRELHAAISQQPNADRLQAVLGRYSEWLKTLSAAQQAEVASLPTEKRLAKIKELQQSQLQFQFFEVAVSLEKEDLDTLNAWMTDFVSRHEAEILAKVDSAVATRIVSTLNPALRRKQLLDAFFWPRRAPRSTSLPAPTEEDFKRLAAQLSPTLQSNLSLQKSDENRRTLIMTCAGYAHFNRFRPPPPSDEELGKFYANLSAEERDELDKLDRRQMKWELTGRYYRSMFPGRQGGRRSMGQNGDGGAGLGPSGAPAALRSDGKGPPRGAPAKSPRLEKGAKDGNRAEPPQSDGDSDSN